MVDYGADVQPLHSYLGFSLPEMTYCLGAGWSQEVSYSATVQQYSTICTSSYCSHLFGRKSPDAGFHLLHFYVVQPRTFRYRPLSKKKIFA